MLEFKVLKKDRRTNARVGILKTPHGIIETPSYVVVGTHGAVRCLSSEDIPKTKTQLIISNTYHLWRTFEHEPRSAYRLIGRSGPLGQVLPSHLVRGAGPDKLNNLPDLHEYMWPGPIMTDSGGFQVFSLGFGREHGLGKLWNNVPAGERKNLVKVTEDGARFNDDYGESYLDAETSIKIQEKLGADIIVAFDEPTSPFHDYAYTKESLERTHKWALRSLAARTRKDQAMYGVVQGGAFRDLREESAKFIGAQSFEGFAIGGSYGESMGAPREQMLSVIRWSAAHLPEKKPRHLLGIGKIEDVFDAVELGMDTFDCVIPTREARHGSLWTKFGRLDIKRSIWQGSHMKIQGDCRCPVCSETKLTRGELRELFKAKNQSAGRLATMHNIFFFNNLLEKIRNSIKEGRFLEFKKEFLANLRRSEK